MLRDYDSIYAYSLPGCKTFHVSLGRFEEGIHSGFVVSPFIVKDGLGTIIPTATCTMADMDIELERLVSSADLLHSDMQDYVSTPKEIYTTEVSTIIEEIKDRDKAKTIACRRIAGQGKISVRQTLGKLSESLPNSFRFVFYTPRSGAWMGASPELLLEAEDGKLHTYALAGTRPSESQNSWDSKNLGEHLIVVDFLRDIFQYHGAAPTVGATTTRVAGTVEHLLTEIYADADDLTQAANQCRAASSGQFNLADFLQELSPTPALCGMPKEESLQRILRIESFPREYYGGFCGPYNDVNSFKFFVILRSLKFSKRKWCLYAGGGITKYSDPDAEWEETQFKSATISGNIIYEDSNIN